MGDRVILLRDGGIVQEGAAEDILSNPADDYVAGFVRHADRCRVLTAGSIMAPPTAVAVLGLDGPRTALRKIRSHGLSSLIVIDAFHTVMGVVEENDLEALKTEGKRDLSLIMRQDVITIGEDVLLTDIIPIAANIPYPLPVVDDRRRLRGVIVRGLLLEALSSQYGDAETGGRENGASRHADSESEQSSLTAETEQRSQ